MITAVIGHGRSPEGRGWGQKIDATDRVVRLWNWHWQEREDYGERYDWGLLEVHSYILKWRTYNQHWPSQGWIASVLNMEAEYMKLLPPNAILIDQKEAFFKNYPVSKWGSGETGRWFLTRGGIAACWAISTSRKDDVVILVGFDNISLGFALPTNEAFSPSYQESNGFWGINGYRPGSTKEGNHDYQAERQLIEFMARQHGVHVVFACEDWPDDPDLELVEELENMPLFRYCGAYPNDQECIKIYGCEFRPGDEIEVPAQFLEKARQNRFFDEVTAEKPPSHVLNKTDLLRLADNKGIEVDENWSEDRIVAALDQPYSDPVEDPLQGLDRDALIALAGERGVKIDKRWKPEKIAAAINESGR